ncbi:hypothetical protein COO60DRAFT_1133596 [Scenedesmus sp. NREL 46B-D3]|nr:hypothetical protein COO60DRAFT_1133596 [Scenedesmus sp. NREL 46B-D3]
MPPLLHAQLLLPSQQAGVRQQVQLHTHGLPPQLAEVNAQQQLLLAAAAAAAWQVAVTLSCLGSPWRPESAPPAAPRATAQTRAGRRSAASAKSMGTHSATVAVPAPTAARCTRRAPRTASWGRATSATVGAREACVPAEPGRCALRCVRPSRAHGQVLPWLLQALRAAWALDRAVHGQGLRGVRQGRPLGWLAGVRSRAAAQRQQAVGSRARQAWRKWHGSSCSSSSSSSRPTQGV